MKNLIILIFCFVCFDAFSQIQEVKVISASFGVEDHLGKPSLCLTEVETQDGEILGLLEDITDCFYTRQAKRHEFISIEMKYFSLLEEVDLIQHLQLREADLKFYFSSGE